MNVKFNTVSMFLLLVMSIIFSTAMFFLVMKIQETLMEYGYSEFESAVMIAAVDVVMIPFIILCWRREQ